MQRSTLKEDVRSEWSPAQLAHGIAEVALDLSRRTVFASVLAAPAVKGKLDGMAVTPARLPDHRNFRLDHTYLNAAYVHPMGEMTYRPTNAFLQKRMYEVDTPWSVDNSHNAAVNLFARLINADPKDIAVVPSTMEGENLIVQALSLTGDTRVVTDAFHYSPEIYGERHRRGVPVTVVMPRNNRIPLDELDRAIDHRTRLVAVSAVSSDTGFRHDLKAVCDIAHAKGAMVYADIIQAAGAIPLDVKATGVDFCCCGAYKWLMGDFGVAFLYVRPDRLDRLSRVFVGWRQLDQYTSRLYPFDPQDPPGVQYSLRNDTAGLFEVSTPDWAALAGLVGSLTYIQDLGAGRIAGYRAPLMARLQSDMPARGFIPLTPTDMDTPIVAFAYKDAAVRLKPVLEAARIKVQLSKNRVRISPSVYNDMGDIDRLLDALGRTA